MKHLFIPKAEVIENFLTDEEIFEIEFLFRQFADIDIQVEKYGLTMSAAAGIGHPTARSHYWYPGPSCRNQINNFLTSKVQDKYGVDLECENWHILNAFMPYGVHSDSYDEEDHQATQLPAPYEYAYTFLIPLEDFNTNTIVFNEYSNISKIPKRWIEKTGHSPINAIDSDLYKQYFTHESPEILSHFSIDTIFPWKKGNLLSMARHSFHCSDNFPAKQILQKRALVGWSYSKDLNDLR